MTNSLEMAKVFLMVSATDFYIVTKEASSPNNLVLARINANPPVTPSTVWAKSNSCFAVSCVIQYSAGALSDNKDTIYSLFAYGNLGAFYSLDAATGGLKISRYIIQPSNCAQAFSLKFRNAKLYMTAE